MILRQTELNITEELNVGQRVLFTSQWQAIGGHYESHGDPAESAEIIGRQCRVDGSVFDYQLRVDDGCTLWAAPWEVTKS